MPSKYFVSEEHREKYMQSTQDFLKISDIQNALLTEASNWNLADFYRKELLSGKFDKIPKRDRLNLRDNKIIKGGRFMADFEVTDYGRKLLQSAKSELPDKLETRPSPNQISAVPDESYLKHVYEEVQKLRSESQRLAWEKRKNR
jgi:hypothetical protein